MNENIINILNSITLLLQIKGESFFKFSAYSNAIEIIKQQSLDIEKLVQENKLSEIKGFGKALTEKITEYVLTGKMTYYEKLCAEIPDSLIELLKIDNIGPKKAFQLYKELGVKNVDDLENICLGNSLSELKGFTSDSTAKILKSINEYKNNSAYKSRNIDFDQIQ